MTEPNPSPSDGPTAGCEDLLGCLAEEQNALEHLLFKLREQYLILASGEHRWLAQSTAEVESAVHMLTAVGRRRQDVADRIHAAHGLPAGSHLAELASRMDDELTCGEILQRRHALRDILDQVRRCSRRNREMLAAGLTAVNDALSLLGSVPTYDSAGSLDRSPAETLRTFDARV